MALVTVQRSPSPTRSDSYCSEQEEVVQSKVDSDHHDKSGRSEHRSLKGVINSVRFINRLRFSENYFTIKGAALILPRSEKCLQRRKSKVANTKPAGRGIQGHLQSMFHLLRPQDTIQVAIKLENVSQCDKYLAICVTQGVNNTEEGIILGFNCFPDSSAAIALVLPVWQNVEISLNGDGGFKVNSDEKSHTFKPVSVQTMWSALNALNKIAQVARQYRYVPTGITHDWVNFYTAKLTTNQSIINEWNAMEDLMVSRSDAPVAMDTDSERCQIERQIRQQLRGVMVGSDLEEITSYQLRIELEKILEMSLKKYRSFIDQEMLLIVRQLDCSSEIFPFLYLGSEWNASNMQELTTNGIGYILNVTREIDNFFPGDFKYMNIRVYDDEDAELMKYWEKTHRFICKARDGNSKVLIHCKMGVSRSASTVIAFAMKEYNWSLAEATTYVSSKRSVVRPNDSFLRQLETYEGILNASNQRLNPVWNQAHSGHVLSREDNSCDIIGESSTDSTCEEYENSEAHQSTNASASAMYDINDVASGYSSHRYSGHLISPYDSDSSRSSHDTDESDLSSQEESDDEVQMINYQLLDDGFNITQKSSKTVPHYITLHNPEIFTQSELVNLSQGEGDLTSAVTIATEKIPDMPHCSCASAAARILHRGEGGTQSCPTTPKNRRRLVKSMPDLYKRRGSSSKLESGKHKKDKSRADVQSCDENAFLRHKQAHSLPRDTNINIIAQYEKEVIPYTPGTVRRHREQLESPMLMGDNTGLHSTAAPHENILPAVTPGIVRKVAEEIEERYKTCPITRHTDSLVRSSSFKLERVRKLGAFHRSASVRETKTKPWPDFASPSLANKGLEYWQAFSKVQQKRVNSPPDKVHFHIGDDLCGIEQLSFLSPEKNASVPMISLPTKHQMESDSKTEEIFSANIPSNSSSVTVKALVDVFEDVSCTDCLNSEPLTVRVASFNSDPFTKPIKSSSLSPLQRSHSLRKLPGTPQTIVPRTESFSRPKFTFEIRDMTASTQTILQPYWKIKQENAYCSKS